MHAIARMILTSLPTIEYGEKTPGSEPILWLTPALREPSTNELETLREIEEIERKIEHFGFSVLLMDDAESDKLMQTLVDEVQQALRLGRGIPSVGDLSQLGVLADAIRSDLDRRLFSTMLGSA